VRGEKFFEASGNLLDQTSSPNLQACPHLPSRDGLAAVRHTLRGPPPFLFIISYSFSYFCDGHSLHFFASLSLFPFPTQECVLAARSRNPLFPTGAPELPNGAARSYRPTASPFFPFYLSGWSPFPLKFFFLLWVKKQVRSTHSGNFLTKFIFLSLFPV